jgi:tRNA modification GTPase
MLARARPENTVVVLNKIDLMAAGSRRQEFSQPGVTTVAISALTGVGVEELIAALARQADRFRQEAGDEVIAINARHSNALERARASLCAAQEKLRHAEPVELMASDLRDVLAAYGEIGGKIDNERMLDRLFASFCIGK